MMDRFNANIDGYDLEVASIDDTIEKSLVRHRFPYRDGALLDDLGLKARVVKLRVYFYNEGYERHKDFLNHLKGRYLFELVHPKYGLMLGGIEAVSTRHDDRKQTAEMDITFVEDISSISGIEGATAPATVGASIEDVYERAFRHRFPYRDGALLDDLGLKARVVKLRVYFYNEGYERHKDFLNHLKGRYLFELVHPKYGLMLGGIEAVSTRHDDRKQTAEMDITFVEDISSISGIEGATAPATVGASIEDVYERAVVEEREAFANDARVELGAEAEEILSKELDPDLGVLEQFSGLSRKARVWVKKVDEYVGIMKAELNAVANPANTLIATIDYGADLPGVVALAVARTAERYAIFYDGIRSAPTRFIQSLFDGMTGLENALGFNGRTRAGAAHRASLELGGIFEVDQDDRQRARALESVKSFDVLGNYLNPETAPKVLTTNDIEGSLYRVRLYVQGIIDASRPQASLKEMVLKLQEHALKLKIESETLVAVEIDNETPLHLICLRYGLPYRYAERLMAVNTIKHPNFVKGEVKIHAA